MKELPNNCRSSELSVFPKNWEKPGASLSKNWYVSFTFYDYSTIQKSKLIIKKGGINRFRSLGERREAVKLVLAAIQTVLNQGYNFITGKSFLVLDQTQSDIDPKTPFSEALNRVKDMVKVAHNTRTDIKSSVKYIIQSAENLHYDRIPIYEIRRKHLRLILDNCRKIKDYWSPHLYNRYRTNLSILFTELLELEAVDSNPVLAIKKESIVEKLRETMELSDRIKINDHFAMVDPYFRRFLEIFFHSGARPVELLRITAADVNLDKQVYKVTVKKGKKAREEERPIIDSVLHCWKQILDEIQLGKLEYKNKAEAKDALKDPLNFKANEVFLFGKLLRPSKIFQARDYVSKKYLKEVKVKLGITADMYSLKHSNLDEVAAELDIKAAQDQAGHTTPVITMKYAKGEKGRSHDRIRKVSNKFAG